MTQTLKHRVDTRVIVETPEGVDFQFVIAGPGKRGAALAIDWGVKFALLFGTLFLLGLAGLAIGHQIFTGGMGVWLTLLFMIDWFYSSLFETFWNGQTPGKKSLRLRVVRTNGTPITAASAIGRNFLAAADSLPRLAFGLYTVGLLAMLSNRRMQRLGDLIFDTMVVDESREWISRAAGVTAGIEPITRSECSGRYSVPERTLAVIERLFEGDRLVADARREEIARPLSLVLRKSMGYEEPGPDSHNPHLYFQQVPLRHTVFLRRVLKTFADQPDVSMSAKQRNSQQAGSLSMDPVRRRKTVGAPQRDAGVSLDEWLNAEGHAFEPAERPTGSQSS